MSKLLDRIKKVSTIEGASLLENSKIFDMNYVDTGVYAINLLLSGRLDGGLVNGTHQLAGVSKNFKTGFSLLIANSYLKKYQDGILLFFDSEFGASNLFKSLNVDKKRVFHVPIKTIEDLKFELIKYLEEFTKDDKVIIVIDSIGNLASKKELEDAINSKGAADMTRAKELKSLFRMVTPYTAIKDIPIIAINHTYKEMSLYPKDIVSGGTGAYYSSQNVYIIGRQQEKDGTELNGYNFVIKADKSRSIREGTKIPITITYKEGINKYSGLLDIAEELNFVQKPSNGWFSRVNPDTGEVEEKKWRRKDTNTKEFWDMLLTSEKFKNAIYEQYCTSSHSVIIDDDIDAVEDEEESGE